MSNHHARRPSWPHTIRRLSVPILLLWVALAAITNSTVPQLEEVGRVHNVALSSPDAPSLQATKHIGKVFHEFDSDSTAMVVLEGDKPLGDAAHRFYDTMIQKIEQDKNPSAASAILSITSRPRRASRPMSPARRRSPRISSKWAVKVPRRSPR